MTRIQRLILALGAVALAIAVYTTPHYYRIGNRTVIAERGQARGTNAPRADLPAGLLRVIAVLGCTGLLWLAARPGTVKADVRPKHPQTLADVMTQQQLQEKGISPELAKLTPDDLIRRMMKHRMPMAPDVNPIRTSAGIGREEARKIAESHVVLNRWPLGSKVEAIYAWGELPYAEPRVPGVDLTDCWIAYVVRPLSALRIESSRIVAISRENGEVIYAGSAHDEG